MIEKGYKVARVEQTETPEMLQERTKGKTGAQKEKVVSRAICQISTRGVRIPTFQDDPYSSPFTHDARYLYGIFERVIYCNEN
jgi:DNA mismatch repair protein MSH6